MFFSKLSNLALTIASLSAMAAATTYDTALVYSGPDFYGPPQGAKLNDCTNLVGPPNRYFHHAGSIEIPPGHYCTLYSERHCWEGSEVMCTLGDSSADLMSFPNVVCADESPHKGVGYTAESVYCGPIDAEAGAGN